MLKFVRNTNGFSEFQLGIIQSWAAEKNSQIMLTPDFLVIRVLQKDSNITLLYWEYGDDPMIGVGKSLMGLAEFEAYLSALSGRIPPETETEMKALMTSISELLECTQWF